MASTLKVNSVVSTDHFALSRQFFIAWQQRNASRQALWGETPTDQGPALAQTTSRLYCDSLQNKIQHLKSEIVSLLQHGKNNPILSSYLEAANYFRDKKLNHSVTLEEKFDIAQYNSYISIGDH
jgi:hypothetical protein